MYNNSDRSANLIVLFFLLLIKVGLMFLEALVFKCLGNWFICPLFDIKAQSYENYFILGLILKFCIRYYNLLFANTNNDDDNVLATNCVSSIVGGVYLLLTYLIALIVHIVI